MARQNVGNPKFYIDMLSFFKAQGSFDSITDINIIGELNPVESIIETYSSSATREYLVELNHDNRMSGDSNFKHWLGFFNHNFYSSGIINPIINTLDSTDTGVESVLGNSFTEICNFPLATDSIFENNGWSMAEYEPLGSAFRKINISMTNSNTSDSEVMLSTIGFGQVFQMPHSPDLQLTIAREYDGIKTQQTKGGSTLTQINYTGSPHWGSMYAWYIGQHNLLSQESSGYKERRQYGRGRRIWDLKFSYISSDNLFPVNEAISRLNPTDSAYLSDYSDYIDSSNDFNTDAFDSSSFMSVVMGKTLGGALPFIFQPDGNNNSPDQFAICQIDQGSFQFKQVAHNVYDISLKIREVW